MKQYLYTFNQPKDCYRIAGCGYVMAHGFTIEDSKFKFLDENGLTVSSLPISVVKELDVIDHDSRNRRSVYRSNLAAPVEVEAQDA